MSLTSANLPGQSLPRAAVPAEARAGGGHLAGAAGELVAMLSRARTRLPAGEGGPPRLPGLLTGVNLAGSIHSMPKTAQREVAERIGVQRPAVSKMERKADMSMSR